MSSSRSSHSNDQHSVDHLQLSAPLDLTHSPPVKPLQKESPPPALAPASTTTTDRSLLSTPRITETPTRTIDSSAAFPSSNSLASLPPAAPTFDSPGRFAPVGQSYPSPIQSGFKTPVSKGSSSRPSISSERVARTLTFGDEDRPSPLSHKGRVLGFGSSPAMSRSPGSAVGTTSSVNPMLTNQPVNPVSTSQPVEAIPTSHQSRVEQSKSEAATTTASTREKGHSFFKCLVTVCSSLIGQQWIGCLELVDI